MKITSMLPFMKEEEIDLLLDKVVDGEITNVSVGSLLPFASDEKIDEVFIKTYKNGGKFTTFLPFVSEKALHEIVVEYCEKGGQEISDNLLPFIDEDDVAMIFRHELNKNCK